MDLNPLFTSHEAFRPAGDGGALKLFEQAQIKLVHGWLVDPNSAEYRVLSVTEDYDTSVNLIVAADDVTKGQLVVDDAAEPGSSQAAGPSNVQMDAAGRDNWSQEDHKKIEDGACLNQTLTFGYDARAVPFDD